METRKKNETPKSYPPEAVLNIEQLAEWLGVSVRQAERQSIPCFYLGTRTRRYLAKSVIEHLEKRVA